MEFTTPALLFPAISLVTLAYTNRFLGLSAVIRNLYREYINHPDNAVAEQIDNLRRRVVMVRNMQIAGALSMVTCMASIFLLLANLPQIGLAVFVISLLLLTISILISIQELIISDYALKILLTGMEENTKQ